MQNTKITQIFLVILFLFLGSCGGGGGGGGGNSSPTTSNTTNNSESWISSVSTSEVNSYRTTEYNVQWGLEEINAAEAYALLEANSKTIAGSGVTISIIDSGVQSTHVEIANNYDSSGSYDYVNSDSDPSDDNGHGTHVASIAAGAKDGSGMHGVAYESTIISQKVLNASGSGNTTNVANGITNSVRQGADIINMSLGSSSASTTIYNALLNAKNSGALVIAATGNDGNSQPDYPAYYASNSALAGYVLAVGAIGYDGTLASYSNYCGDAKSYCLVAPGGSNDGNSAHGIYAALPIGSTIDLNSAYGCNSSGYCSLSGTSMATPTVAGAAAVIKGAWSFLSAPQISSILLTSANRSFSGYDENKYGQGILDLYAAVQAQGQNTLGYGSSVVSNAGYDVRDSAITSDAIFGDAFSTRVAPQLSEAIFYDDYGRDYQANLGNKITARSNNIAASFNAIAFNNYKNQIIPLNFGNKSATQLNLQIRSYSNQAALNQLGLKYATIDHSQEDKTLSASSGFSFSQNFDQTFISNSNILSDFKFGFSFNRDEVSKMMNSKFNNLGFISVNNWASNPFQSFVMNSYNAANVYSPIQRNYNQIFLATKFFDEKFAINFSQQNAYDSTSIFAVKSVQNSLNDFNFSYVPNSSSHFSVSFGNLNEFQNNILNSKAVGAFSAAGNSKTSYWKLSLSQKLFADLSMITSYAEGKTTVQGNNLGIFRDYSDILSRSTSIGLVDENFLSGKFGLIYSQPMRVYRGSAVINIPVARDENGNISRYSTTVSLKPKGREQDIEIFYAKNLQFINFIESALKFNFIVQLQPSNIKNADNAYLGMVNWNGKF